MDENRRATLQQELDEAVRKRNQLTTVIAYLAEQLGVEVPSEDPSGGGGSTKQAQVAPPGTDPVGSVSEGEFFGQTAPKATEALMRRLGQSRPLKTDEIFDAVKRGGVKISSSEGLYRTLHRNPKFVRVGRGIWGLREWYPEGALKSRDDDNDHAETSDDSSSEGGQSGGAESIEEAS